MISQKCSVKNKSGEHDGQSAEFAAGVRSVSTPAQTQSVVLFASRGDCGHHLLEAFRQLEAAPKADDIEDL